MATIRHRGTSWQVIVKRKGHPTQRKNFKTKAPAAAWARRIETSMDNGSWIDTRGTRLTLIDGIIDNLIHSFERFDLEVAGPKMSALNQLKRYFEGWSIHDLTVDDVLDFAAHRRRTVSPSTLQKQMSYLQQAIRVSRVKVEEDVTGIAIKELVDRKIIMGSVHRDRRLKPGEYDRIKEAAGNHKWIMLAVDIALESGMRQGEIHALKHTDIDLEKGLITLLRKDKKSIGGKKKAVIPLFKGVREVLLRGQNYFGKADTLFHVNNAASISDKFALVCKEANIHDLTFHDLRHEALSRMFEIKKMTLEQVQVVSGHSSFDQLSRYVNLRPEDLVDL